MRAAQYLRMSTEHQRYSTENQAAAIALFALKHRYEIVQTYSDQGISGLSLTRREGLQRLLADALAGDAPFSVILVYDVSRWGRFQNPDQSAHYEFLCAEAGVRVEYCAELFDNDGSLSSTLLKSLKRVMAAEYSRDLSTKVTAGRLALSRKGFWLGPGGGYGLRRQMVGPDGCLGPILEPGQSKALQGWHNILAPGPPEEVAVVQRIFQLYVHAGLKRNAIAALLNREGIPGEGGRLWTFDTVTRLLTSPKYVGDLVANVWTSRLGSRPVLVDPSARVRRRSAFQGIVDRKLFDAAQRLFAQRGKRRSREALLDIAREIHATHGRLTARLIDEAPGAPTSSAFVQRFGSMTDLCAALGHPSGRPRRKRPFRLPPNEALRRLAELHRTTGYLNAKVISAAPDVPSVTYYCGRFGSIRTVYALVGFVPMTRAQLLSPVGRARLDAAEVRAERLRNAVADLPATVTRSPSAPDRANERSGPAPAAQEGAPRSGSARQPLGG
jgi:DNA invertase Pin-like site-specific DNA recombinase